MLIGGSKPRVAKEPLFSTFFLVFQPSILGSVVSEPQPFCKLTEPPTRQTRSIPMQHLIRLNGKRTQWGRVKSIMFETLTPNKLYCHEDQMIFLHQIMVRLKRINVICYMLYVDLLFLQPWRWKRVCTCEQIYPHSDPLSFSFGESSHFGEHIVSQLRLES